MKQKLFTPREHMGLFPVFVWVRVANMFRFCCFVCLRTVSCELNIFSVSDFLIILAVSVRFIHIVVYIIKYKFWDIKWVIIGH